MKRFLFKVFLFVLIAKCVGFEDALLDKPLYPTPIIDSINNNPDAGWTAGVNERFINSTLRDFMRIGGVEPRIMHKRRAEIPKDLEGALKQLPFSFDARDKWNCASMSRILNQGTCGSCWAFSAVQVLQDRLCTFFGVDVELSANNILACCGSSCGTCALGDIRHTYDYLYEKGTVSAACSPYFDTSACSSVCQAEDTPTCKDSCEDGGDWNQRYRTTSYPKEFWSITDTMKEIMNKGPVSAFINAHEDLITYKTGVYQHVEGKLIIGHYVKLIGWGVTDEGQRYWIATNQWSSAWGEDGHFKIRLGVDECGIESTHPIAATPKDPSTTLAYM